MSVDTPRHDSPSGRFERRLAAILSADVQGYSRLMGEDEELTVHTLTAYRTVFSELVAHHHGRVVDSPGDNILAEFASAVEAVQCAVRIQQALHERNTRLSPERRMLFRIGINLGDVLVEGEQIYGDGVNIAARLEGLAKGGGICISQTVHDQVEGILPFRYHALGEQQIKNIARLIRAYWVHWENTEEQPESSAPTTPAVRAPVQSNVPLRPREHFVGRAAEIAFLERCLETASQGRRQIVFVTGEPGIGKTTLLDVFLERLRARPEIRLAYGQCIEQYGTGEAYLPLLEATNRLCRESRDDRVITGLKQYAPTWLAQLPALVDPGDLELLQQHAQGTNRERMLREMAEAAEIFTARRGLVLILEDLQWSDTATLEWLAYIARRRAPAKLLILGTYRPTEALVDDHPLKGLVQELLVSGQCEELRLTPLNQQDTSAYLASRFTGATVPSALTEALHRRTGGNPLFMVKLADYLTQQGVIVAGDGRWGLKDDTHAMEESVPDTLRQLIEKQFESLAEEDQQILEVASVVGREFTTAALAAGLQTTIEALEKRCEQLARNGQFVRSDGIEEWPNGTLSSRYSFVHALYQQVLYEQMAEARRVRVHRACGLRKEQAYGAQAHTIAAELAVHFAVGRDPQRAIKYSQQAAETALRRHAHQEAIAHLNRGLSLVKLLPDTPERAQQELMLQVPLGTTLMATKGYAAPDVERAYGRARELCRRLGETPQLFPVLAGLLGFYFVRGDLQSAQALGEQLSTLAQRTRHPVHLLWSHVLVGEILFHRGELRAGHEHLEQSLALYASQRRYSSTPRSELDPGVSCLMFMSHCLWFLGYPDQALTKIHDALTLAQELAHPFSLANALTFAAMLHIYRGEAQAAQEQAEAVITLSTDQGFPHWLAEGTMLQGHALAEQGRGEEGIEQMRQGMATWRATGAELGWPGFLAWLAEAYGRGEQPEEGLKVLAEALTAATKTGQQYWDAELYRLKGQLTLQKFQVSSFKFQAPANTQHPTSNAQAEAEAETCFHTALEVARRQQAKALELRAATSLARLWQQQGKNAEARELLEDIHGRFTEGFDTADLQEAQRVLQALGSTINATKGRTQREESTRASSIRDPQPLVPALVGREAELTQLQHWLDQALAGERQLVFVSGEPGIGKTTLVDTFLARLRERGEVRIAYGQCVEQYGSGEAYLPLLEATNRLCRESGSERRIAALKQYAPTWLAQLPGLVERQELELLQQQVQGTSRERMLREMAEAAELFTARRGLVLVLEDLHWSDVSTLDWLAHIARRREPAKLMIIGTYRPTDVLASGHPLRKVAQELYARGQAEELHLAPLAETAVQDYLTTRFPGMTISPELLGALHQRTGGNPLFLTTMADYLSAHGVIVADEGRWMVTSELHALESEVPENLRLLIEKQLDRLDKQARSMLEVASVVGAEFSVAVVAAGLQQPLEPLEETCERLAHGGQFISARGLEEWPDGTFSSRYGFTHALYQTVLSDRIVAARRVHLHRLIAARREKAYGERAREIAVELAMHFEAGRDFAKAIHYRERAGALAARRHAHQEAVAHFESGLTLLETQPDTPARTQHELRLLMAAGGSLIPLKGYTAPAIEETFARALTLCRRIEDHSQVFPALWGLFGFYMARAELGKAGELAAQMSQLARQTRDTFLELGSAFVKGQVALHSGDLVTARPHFARATALYDARLHSARVFRTVQDTGVATLSLQAATLWMLGFPDQALARAQEAVALARRLSHPMSLAWALNLQTTVHYFRREEKEIRARAEEALQFALEQEMPYWIAMSKLLHGWSRLNEEGITQIQHGLEMLRHIGANVGRPSYLAFLAEAYAAQGNPVQGLAILDEALTTVETTGERTAEAELYRLKGELTLQKAGVGDWGLGAGNEKEQKTEMEAEGYFQHALDRARRQQAKSWELRAATSLARVWHRQGKSAAARQLLEDVYSWFSEGFSTKDLQEAETLLRETGSTVKRAGARRDVEGSMPEASAPLPGSPLSLQPTASNLSQTLDLGPQDSRARIPDTQHPAPDTQYVFRREAEYWTLVFDGVVFRVEHALGLQYIAQLLRHPHQEFTAVFLATGKEASPEPTDFGATGDRRAPQVTATARQHLTDLQEELAEAREFNNQGRIERLQEELETLAQELTQTLGSGRRHRATTSPAERARLNVTRAIRSTLKKITASHPSLGHHLTQTIKTGTTCVYNPDSSPPLPWQF